MVNVLESAVGVLLFLLALTAFIAIHEIGHLVPAKIFGVRVMEYMIGFGPTIWSKRKGETEYGFKAIPLGGYISMVGMFPPAPQDPAGTLRHSSTGMFQALIRDAHEAEADRIQPGDEGRLFYQLSTWKKIVIMAGGPLMNLVMGTLLIAVMLISVGNPADPQATTSLATVHKCMVPAGTKQTTCTDQDPASPAAAAGLRPADVITGVDGQPIQSWSAIVSKVRAAGDQPLTLTIDRDGTSQTLSLTPKVTDVAKIVNGEYVRNPDGSLQTERAGFIGVSPTFVNGPGSITMVPAVVGGQLAQVGKAILSLPQRMVDVAKAAFGPGQRDPNGPIGMVGIGRISAEVASIDEFDLTAKVTGMLSIFASLNLFLFAFNLVPLLPLDGGRIAGALWESLRRHLARIFKRPDPGPLDLAKSLPFTYAVFAVLALMSLMLLYADIVKPISLRG